MFFIIKIGHCLLCPSQHLVQLFLHEETVRVITAGNAILQKSHMYEVLVDLQHTAGAWSETQQVHLDMGILVTSDMKYISLIITIIIRRRKWRMPTAPWRRNHL